jgi:hypothetical protein
MDWSIAAALGLLRSDVPILGFIQNTRHANRGSELRGWLKRFATRVCVGEEVTRAVLRTGEVSGPIYTITNGIESLEELRLSRSARTTDILVSGCKDPALARAIGTQLANAGLRVEILTDYCSRVVFLNKIKLANVAVLIPQPQEGAFLPSLEAMALDVAVVCPDTPGIHGYCRHDETAILPERSANALANAARKLLVDKDLSDRLRLNGLAMAQYYTLERERAAFLPILAQMLGI